jgi:hypothetical protein
MKPTMMSSFEESAKKSYDAKLSYVEKLERASGIDVYKYVLLINVAALEGYVAQARLQAQHSFNLSRVIAIVGFAIVAIAIVISVVLTMNGNDNLNAAYLSAIAGIFTEFISGVFFYLYSKTLSQINLFHDKLVDMQKTALNHITNAKVNDNLQLQSPDSPDMANRKEGVEMAM